MKFILLAVFLAGLLILNPRDGTISSKYKKIDYLGSLILSIIILVTELIIQFGNLQKNFPRVELLVILFLSMLFLYSGTINVHYRKEINDDTSYKFGVSFFLCGWIGVFYLLAELFLK